MKFLLPKTTTPKSFDLEQHWAGKLPEAAHEILDIFHYPEVYAHFGTPVPKGILLHGLPGTGKTHFARMIAEVTDASFFYAAASQFDELFVGKGPQRVRNLFEQAQQSTEYSLTEKIRASCLGITLPQKRAVIFIDELDAIGNRNQSLHTSSTHGTVSQLLTCLDGMTSSDNIFIIAATNNLKQIDPALRRSGRFDRVITMPLPDFNSRLKLLEFYVGGCPGYEKLESDGTLKKYATMTKGFAAADIKNMANEATMAAIKHTINSRREQGLPVQNQNQLDSKNYTITEQYLDKAFKDVQTKLKSERTDKSVTFSTTDFVQNIKTYWDNNAKEKEEREDSSSLDQID